MSKDTIYRQAAIDAADEIIARDESGNNDVVKALRAWKAYIKALPSAQPELAQNLHTTCTDAISRQAAIDIERNATVDTNPSHFEAHQKFTQFMDDAEVSSFGRWQWANGFNTALTAVGIDLKKLPSAKKEITLEDVKAYCEPRCLQIVTRHMMLQPQEEKEIKHLRELAARILGKYEEEKKKQLAAVRLASLRGIERDRAKELQARTEREIENLRKEIKGE